MKDEPFNDMLDRCAWLVIQNIIKGERLQGCMMQVFNIIRGWQKENFK